MKNLLGALIGIFIISFLLSLEGIAMAQQKITITCDPCYVKNCQCAVSCSTGKMYTYASASCIGTENSIIYFSNYSAEFISVQPGQFYARVECADSGQVSSCQPIFVSAYPGQTATTTTTQTQQTQQTATPTTLTTTVITAVQTKTTTATKTLTTATTTVMRKENSAPVSTDTILVIVLLAVVLVVVVGLLFYYKRATEN